MEKEIQDIIKKNLPAEVGGVLRDRLQDAEDNEILLKRALKDIQKLEKDADIGNSKIDRLECQLSAHKNLEDREKAVYDKEHYQDVLKLQYELNAEKRISATVENMAMGLVRNTEYKKIITGDAYSETTDKAE